MYDYKQPQSSWDNQGWNESGNGVPQNGQPAGQNSNPSPNYGYGGPENNSGNAYNYNYNPQYGYGQAGYANSALPQAYYPQPYYNQYQYPLTRVDKYGVPYSSRSWVVTLALSFFLGWFGADHFYTGHIGTGILKFITGGGFGIWWLIDMALILGGGFSDNEGRLVKPR